MRRQILQLALLVVALTTSLYGIDQMQTAPSGTMMQENQGKEIFSTMLELP